MRGIMCYILVFNVFIAAAQAGLYVNTPNLTDGNKIKWTVDLKADGTFTYHFFRDVRVSSAASKEVENYYARGTWVLSDKTILFYSEENEDVNLNNSKARYYTKSPRDKTDRIIKTRLRFYESDSPHIKGLELFKQ